MCVPYALSNQFLSFGRKVSERSVPQPLKDMFKDVSRIKEQWYFNNLSDEFYQVKFTFDKNGSWFAIWLDGKDEPYIVEAMLQTSRGIEHLIQRGSSLTIPQIISALTLSSNDEKFDKLLSYGLIPTEKRVTK